MFQMADKVRFITREKVVHDELLFVPGERWDALKVIQTERNLRASYPFRRAEITPVPRPDGRVDALVRTQDSWTTNPRLGLSTSGGQTSASIGIEDNNLFGYGKSIGYEHSQGHAVTGPTHSDSYSYGDPRFLGTRLALSGAYSQHARTGIRIRGRHGRRRSTNSTRLAPLTLSWSNADSVGTEVLGRRALLQVFRAPAPRERGVRRPAQQRPLVRPARRGGLVREPRRVRTDERVPRDLPGHAARELEHVGPHDRILLDPAALREGDVHRAHGARRGLQPRQPAGRAHRLHGARLGLRPGPLDLQCRRPAGTESRRGAFCAGFGGLQRSHLQQPLGKRPRHGELQLLLEELLSGRALGRWQFFHVEAAAKPKSRSEKTRSCSGETRVLRGYKNDSFIGTRSILANLENRFFLDGEYLHLVRFGGVVFVESGSVVSGTSGFSPARFSRQRCRRWEFRAGSGSRSTIRKRRAPGTWRTP